jgi:succinate dehydrogenase / fumarate reductase membrane anchor subunit
MGMSLRTPLARVRGLGSAKEGTEHFMLQRLTAVANIVLVSYLIVLLARYAGADFATVKTVLSRPYNSVALLLLIVSATIHMRLGMQGIIEDYVHSEGAKLAALMLNAFFAIMVAVTCAFAVLKLSFGA